MKTTEKYLVKNFKDIWKIADISTSLSNFIHTPSLSQKDQPPWMQMLCKNDLKLTKKNVNEIVIRTVNKHTHTKTKTCARRKQEKQA